MRPVQAKAGLTAQTHASSQSTKKGQEQGRIETCTDQNRLDCTEACTVKTTRICICKGKSRLAMQLRIIRLLDTALNP